MRIIDTSLTPAAAVAVSLGGVIACGGQTVTGSGADTTAPLDASDFAQSWIVLDTPTSDSLGDLESLVATQSGFAALYRRSLGSGKDTLGWDIHLMTSDDGVTWQEHVVPTDNTATFYRSLAVKGPELVVAGNAGNAPAFATSTNRDDWSPQTLAPDTTGGLFQIAYVGQRFIALSEWGWILTSPDAKTWAQVQTEDAAMSSVAFGNHRWVVVGNGPFQVSDDGQTFHDVSLDCGLVSACITDPSGNQMQGPMNDAVFGGDGFYATSWATDTGASFVSTDGEQWAPVADPSKVPQVYWGGWAMRRDGDAVVGWRPGETTSSRVALTHDNPDGLTCADHRCFVLAGRDSLTQTFKLLVLVP